MDPILVDVAQLRTLTRPALTLTPGRVIVARVIEAAGARSQLAIAGVRVAATLPPGIRAGDELRLVVKEVAAERVVLQIQVEAPPQAPPNDPQEADAEPQAGGIASTTVPSRYIQLSYQTETLGPVDIRLELHAGDALSVAITMQTADGVARARASSETLRAAVAKASGSEVAVLVTPARPPLDLYA